MAFKILLVVAVAFSSVYSFDSKKSTKEIFDSWKKRSENEHPECLKTWSVTSDELDQHFELHEMPKTRNFKCFLHCLYKAFNFIKKDGTIDRAEFVKEIEKASTEMMDSCDAKIVQKTDECERVYEFVDCALHYHHVYL